MTHRGADAHRKKSLLNVRQLRKVHTRLNLELREMISSEQVAALLGDHIDAGIARTPTRHPRLLVARRMANGDVKQSSNTKYLIFDVQRLIEYASAMYTLYLGDVIMTGTPAGVGPVAPGDILEASIAGIGAMSVRVAR